MVQCNNHKWTHTIASWTCCLFVCMCSCIYYKLQYVLLYIHTSISLHNKIINESKISCINYKEIYKRNWIGIDLFWIGIGIGIDKFDVELELELTKWNWVELELELELTKWNWPHVCHHPPPPSCLGDFLTLYFLTDKPLGHVTRSSRMAHFGLRSS